MMDKKHLKKYLSASNFVTLILGIFMLGFGGYFLAVLLPDSDEAVVTLLMGLFIVAMGGVVIWAVFTNIRALNNQLKELESAGQLEWVLEEFNGAEVLVKGKIRLGQNYVFGKGTGRVVRYEEICRVYQYVKKRNFVESVRSLKYVNRQGKALDLCQLQLRGKSDEDVLRIMTVIRSKNPTTQFGYKG